jgi:hypothetical protein
MVLQSKKSPKINSNTANNFSDLGKQLLIANDKNMLRWVVLGIPQDGACIDLFENHSENSLKEDLSNVLPLSNHLFSPWSLPLNAQVTKLCPSKVEDVRKLAYKL